jgi:hypothetical protein
MRKVVLVLALIAVNLGSGFAQKASKARGPSKGIAVAFYDDERLSNPGGRVTLDDFHYFIKQIREIVKRDFPDVEFRVLKRGELLHLPDGTNLNVQTIRPELGYVLAAPGKKRRILNGVQTDADFACAAAAFFRRSSQACPK